MILKITFTTLGFLFSTALTSAVRAADISSTETKANSDTPYSLLWADLRTEPIALSIPEVDKSRYYSVMLCDDNTYNYGYIGTRATGSQAGDYLVAGPDWKGD